MHNQLATKSTFISRKDVEGAENLAATKNGESTFIDNRINYDQIFYFKKRCMDFADDGVLYRASNSNPRGRKRTDANGF